MTGLGKAMSVQAAVKGRTVRLRCFLRIDVNERLIQIIHGGIYLLEALSVILGAESEQSPWNWLKCIQALSSYCKTCPAF